MTTTWREELAWAAGFFDGEGYVGTTEHDKRRFLRLSIKQVDRRVLDRFRAAVRVGHVNGPYSHDSRKNALYGYDVTGSRQVQYVVALLWQFLSPVKRAQAARALSASARSYRKLPTRRYRLKCRRGHLVNEINVYSYQKGPYTIRACRVCRRRQPSVQRSRASYKKAWRRRRMAAALLEAM